MYRCKTGGTLLGVLVAAAITTGCNDVDDNPITPGLETPSPTANTAAPTDTSSQPSNSPSSPETTPTGVDSTPTEADSTPTEADSTPTEADSTPTQDGTTTLDPTESSSNTTTPGTPTIPPSTATQEVSPTPTHWEATATAEATPTATAEATPTATAEATPTATEVATPTATEVATPTATAVATPTATEVATPTATEVATPTATAVATPTATEVATPTATAEATPTATANLDGDADGFIEPEDCNDSDSDIYPGAPEDPNNEPDGIDNDCDNLIDEGLGYGDGSWGDLPASDVNLSFEDIGGDCQPVQNITGLASLSVADIGRFQTGDTALLVNLQSESGELSTVGTWELLTIEEISDDPSATIHFSSDLTNTYVSDSQPAEQQKIALFRVPQFANINVTSQISAMPFDGQCGGILALMVSETANISGSLSASQSGYRGGIQNTTYDSTGLQGESYGGQATKSRLKNLGGGGGGGIDQEYCENCEGPGAGGAHGTNGQDGEQSNPDLSLPAEGGLAYGVSSLETLTMGSGGGAGALDYSYEYGIGGQGGNGGGVVLLYAASLNLSGTIQANGEDGEVGCAQNTDWCGTANSGTSPSEGEPGGGGAGGAIDLKTHNLTTGNNAIRAVGGSGPQSGSSWEKFAGDGGLGLIKIEAQRLNGQVPTDETMNVIANPAPFVPTLP